MIVTIIVFILILSLLVLVHEFGHYLAARRNGIRVEEFGFGLPPRIWGKKIGETVYSINSLPIGGFVRLSGEDPREKKHKNDSRSFANKSILQRTSVIVAGVFANFILAVLVFSIVFMIGVPVPTKQVILENVASGTPAESAGLKPGDKILRFNEKPVNDSVEFIQNTQQNLGKEIKLSIQRDHQTFEISLTPREQYPTDQGPMGVSLLVFEKKSYPFWEAPFVGIKEAFKVSGLMIGGIFSMIASWVTSGTAPKDVAGPVGIAQITGQAVRYGFEAILQFLGILSLNLAIINILPFPALDGGRLLFLAYEAVARKKPRASIEHWVNAIGLAVLISLILVITYNDILRIINTTVLGEQLKRFFSF